MATSGSVYSRSDNRAWNLGDGHGSVEDEKLLNNGYNTGIQVCLRLLWGEMLMF